MYDSQANSITQYLMLVLPETDVTAEDDADATALVVVGCPLCGRDVPAVVLGVVPGKAVLLI